VINLDPRHQGEKGLVPVPTSQGGIMWVHSDLIQIQQWTIVTNRKSKGKAKSFSCKVVCSSSREAETYVASLILTSEQSASLVAGTHFGQQYLKKYNETTAGNQLRNQPSNLQSNPWRRRKSYGTPKLFKKTGRIDCQHLFTSMSWLNWPTSQSKSLSISSRDSPSE